MTVTNYPAGTTTPAAQHTRVVGEGSLRYPAQPWGGGTLTSLCASEEIGAQSIRGKLLCRLETESFPW